jgi:LPS-assembly lipoprotein
MRRALMAFIFVALLCSCGFHLRGYYTIPYQPIAIDGASFPLRRELVKALETDQVRITDEAKDARAILKISDEKEELRILSLSGNGTVAEYEILFTANYTLVKNDGSVIMPTRAIEQRRSFTYNDVAVLSKEEERVMVTREMKEEASQQILRALSTTKSPS